MRRTVHNYHQWAIFSTKVGGSPSPKPELIWSVCTWRCRTGGSWCTAHCSIVYATVQLFTHKTENHVQPAFSWDGVELAQDYRVFIWGAESLVLKTVWRDLQGDVVSHFWERSLGALEIGGKGNQMSWIVSFVHIGKKGLFFTIRSWKYFILGVTEASFISNVLTAQFVLQKSVRAKGK